MKESDSWLKEKSDFSQALDAFIKGELNTDRLIEQLDTLLSEQDLEGGQEQALKQLIVDINIPQSGLEKLLLDRVSEQHTQIFQVPIAEPKIKKNTASEQSEGQPSSLLKSLLECGNERDISPVKAGQVIRGTYCLESKIGTGGMGQVWKALDLIQDAGEAKDRYVAIKFINHEIRRHPYALKALVREFARYKKLIHPNIVKAYELNRDDKEIFIAMEYLKGCELKEFIKQNPQGISLKEAQPLIKAMCDALHYAHSEGIVHLDFKPGNVFYSSVTGACKVIDFGIARLSSQEDRDKTLFDPGSLGAMTTAYASSEMLMESEPDPRDDIYGLACVVFELLSGKHPFNKALSLKAEREKMRPKHIEGIGSGEFQALLHGLNFRREKRTHSAQNFYSELFLPQKLAGKKRAKWLTAGSIFAVGVLIVPFFAYKGYQNWQLDQIILGIEQNTNSSLEDFSALSVEGQQSLLDKPSVSLALIENIINKKEVADDPLKIMSELDLNIQQRLFSDRQVRDRLIAQYSQIIDIDLGQDNFHRAKKLSQRILQQYPDSMRLVKQFNAIPLQQAMRLEELQQHYHQCLSGRSKKLAEQFTCLQTSRQTLTKIDSTHVLLQSPKLTERYHRDILAAIEKNELLYADTLLAHWHLLEPNNVDLRIQLEEQLVYAKKQEQLIEEIKSSDALHLAEILKVLPRLPSNIIANILADPFVRHRLVVFYHDEVTRYIEEHKFSQASQLVSQGVSLFSAKEGEKKEITLLTEIIEKKKVAYLEGLNKSYQQELAKKIPEIEAILGIQKSVSLVDPENSLVSLPELLVHYEKKIDRAIVNYEFTLAARLLDDWKGVKPSDANKAAYIQLIGKKAHFIEANKYIQQINKSNQDGLPEILALLPSLSPQLVNQVIGGASVKQQLVSFYQDSAANYLTDHQFFEASKVISGGISLFTKYDKQKKILIELTQEIEKKKLTYLAIQEALYKKTLSLPVPETGVILDIQSNVAHVAPKHLLVNLPKLAVGYTKKIDHAISSYQFTLAQRLLDDWKLLRASDVKSKKYIQLLDKKIQFIKIDEVIKKIKASKDQALADVLISLVPASFLTEHVLADHLVKQHLMTFYQSQITQYLAEKQFNKALNVVSEGISLLKNSHKEKKVLVQLVKEVDDKKINYLKKQERQYKKQLAESEPSITIIREIIANIVFVSPESDFVKLPDLSKSYGKKIDRSLMGDEYPLAQRLLNDWMQLKPSDAKVPLYVKLAAKKVKYLQAFEQREKASLQLLDVINSNQLVKIGQFIEALASDFSKDDQKKIISPFQKQIISTFQAVIDIDIQQDKFDHASHLVSTVQGFFPKNKQLKNNKKVLSRAKKARINVLLAESKVAVNADTLDAKQVFLPLITIQSIDESYLEGHDEIFQTLKEKLVALTQTEQPVAQLQAVTNRWDDFFITHAPKSVKNKGKYRKIKNLIALRCLFNGRILKKQNKIADAEALFMFGLSLNMKEGTVKNALEKEVLQ